MTTFSVFFSAFISDINTVDVPWLSDFFIGKFSDKYGTRPTIFLLGKKLTFGVKSRPRLYLHTAKLKLRLQYSEIFILLVILCVKQ